MEQIAKCPGSALLPVGGHKKSAAFLVIEEKASSILVKQAYCRHFCQSDKFQESEKGPGWGLFPYQE